MSDAKRHIDLVELYLDSCDDFEPYDHEDIEHRLEEIYNSIRDYKAGDFDID